MRLHQLMKSCPLNGFVLALRWYIPRDQFNFTTKIIANVLYFKTNIKIDRK